MVRKGSSVRVRQRAWVITAHTGDALDEIWTHRARLERHSESQQIALSSVNTQALCRTRTDDPFLTMEGSRHYGCSRTLTNVHEIPGNRRKRSVQPWRPKNGRGEIRGRKMDKTHVPQMSRNARAH